MLDVPHPPIRICEWGHSTRHDLTVSEREAIAHAATRWQQDNRLPHPPLYFTGANGRTLCARQYIGVVEAAGRTVEIYPKLDAHLLDRDEVDDGDATVPLESVMRSVLWMVDVAEFREAPEADTTQLGELPTDFIDLFALLLARNLRAELARGLARQYERLEDDLNVVRGRIDIVAQISRNSNRLDRLACVWDEFTADTPMNRLLRCACRHLLQRSRHDGIAWLLQDCLLLLEDVADVSVVAALQSVRHLRHWDRGMERFRRPFELAHRLLRGFGHALEAAEADTFVFLMDMNKLFEAYVSATLAARFETVVETQRFLGNLLTISPGGIHQYADFFLRDSSGVVWIGDAKYKHLARKMGGAATLSEALPSEQVDNDDAGAPTATPEPKRQQRITLSPDDVRQLTVYAELEARLSGLSSASPRARLMLLYPFVGSGKFQTDVTTTWNGSLFYLIPVRVHQMPDLKSALPPLSLLHD